MAVGHQAVYLLSPLLLYPENFAAAAGDAQITYTWDAAEDAGSYTIRYRPTSPANAPWVMIEDITDTVYLLTGLINDTEYEAQILSEGTAGSVFSPLSYSPLVTATPMGPPMAPAVPTGLSETATTDSLVLRCNAIANAETYDFRYREGTSGAWTDIADQTIPETTIQNLSPNTLYQWQVRAKNMIGNSDYVPDPPREVTTLISVKWFIAGVNGARQEFPIGAGTFSTFSFPGFDPNSTTVGRKVTWDFESPLPLVESRLVKNEATGYFFQFILDVRYLETQAGIRFNFSARAILYINQTSTLSVDAGPELTDFWEQSLVAVRVQAGGSFDYILPGPDNPSAFPADVDEPYTWGSRSHAYGSSLAIINQYNGLSQTDKDATIITLDDGTGRIFSSEDEGSMWDSGATPPAPPVGFSARGNIQLVLDASGNIREKAGDGDWGEAQNGPSGVSALRGIGIDNDGNLFVLHASRFYKRVSITWGTGTPLPSWMTDPQDIAEDDGDIYVLDAGTDKYGTYADGAWDNGIDLPARRYRPGRNRCLRRRGICCR